MQGCRGCFTALIARQLQKIQQIHDIDLRFLNPVSFQVFISLLRYIEANSKYSGRFRKYNALVPEYLKNRPRPFVDHCLRQLTSSEDISEHDIVSLDPATGLFRVKSKHTSEWYNLSFGAGEEMPRCSCKDWFSSFMPCKHFLAVMRLHSEWSWKKLPAKYVNSPYFVTDSEIEFGNTADVAVTEGENTTPEENVLDEEGSSACFTKMFIPKEKQSISL